MKLEISSSLCDFGGWKPYNCVYSGPYSREVSPDSKISLKLNELEKFCLLVVYPSCKHLKFLCNDQVASIDTTIESELYLRFDDWWNFGGFPGIVFWSLAAPMSREKNDMRVADNIGWLIWTLNCAIWQMIIKDFFRVGDLYASSQSRFPKLWTVYLKIH